MSAEHQFLSTLASRLLADDDGVKAREKFQPLPHQVTPQVGNDGEPWDIWLVIAGRGSGKTRGGAEWVHDQLMEFGPAARIGIGGPTFSDARDVCMEGDSGLITLYRDEFPVYNRSLGEARHYLGGYIKFQGSEEPARWNGPQWTHLWLDELALWVEESYHQAMFGLRLGIHPRMLGTTTPKNRLFVKDLAEEPNVAVTKATTNDNFHLPQKARDRLYRKYGGTVLGRQELLAEWVLDVEGALWNSGVIDDWRIGGRLGPKFCPTFKRVVVAIDPAGTHKKESDFTGICVAAVGWDGRIYILHIGEYKLSPGGWGNRALMLYDENEADCIVGEANNGGDMVEHTIMTCVPKGRIRPAYKKVTASRGKAVRAEPVASLYEKGEVSHVGLFAPAETQMCQFPVASEKKDMVDALVWAVTELSTDPGVISWNPEESDRQDPWVKGAPVRWGGVHRR